MDFIGLLFIAAGFVAMYYAPKDFLRPFLIKFSLVFILPVMGIFVGAQLYDKFNPPQEVSLEEIHKELYEGTQVKSVNPHKHKVAARKNFKWI